MIFGVGRPLERVEVRVIRIYIHEIIKEHI